MSTLLSGGADAQVPAGPGPNPACPLRGASVVQKCTGHGKPNQSMAFFTGSEHVLSCRWTHWTQAHWGRAAAGTLLGMMLTAIVLGCSGGPAPVWASPSAGGQSVHPQRGTQPGRSAQCPSHGCLWAPAWGVSWGDMPCVAAPLRAWDHGVPRLWPLLLPQAPLATICLFSGTKHSPESDSFLCVHVQPEGGPSVDVPAPQAPNWDLSDAERVL